MRDQQDPKVVLRIIDASLITHLLAGESLANDARVLIYPDLGSRGHLSGPFPGGVQGRSSKRCVHCGWIGIVPVVVVVVIVVVGVGEVERDGCGEIRRRCEWGVAKNDLISGRWICLRILSSSLFFDCTSLVKDARRRSNPTGPAGNERALVRSSTVRRLRSPSCGTRSQLFAALSKNSVLRKVPLPRRDLWSRIRMDPGPREPPDQNSRMRTRTPPTRRPSLSLPQGPRDGWDAGSAAAMSWSGILRVT